MLFIPRLADIQKRQYKRVRFPYWESRTLTDELKDEIVRTEYANRNMEWTDHRHDLIRSIFDIEHNSVRWIVGHTVVMAVGSSSEPLEDREKQDSRLSWSIAVMSVASVAVNCYSQIPVLVWDVKYTCLWIEFDPRLTVQSPVLRVTCMRQVTTSNWAHTPWPSPGSRTIGGGWETWD